MPALPVACVQAAAFHDTSVAAHVGAETTGGVKDAADAWTEICTCFVGVARTIWSIVTAAAALLAVTFLAFATSQISFIKLFGLGLTLAVLMDATLIRATLVPAFMKLAGEANWWAPGPLRRLHARIGFSEAEPHDDEQLLDLPVPIDTTTADHDPMPRPVGVGD